MSAEEWEPAEATLAALERLVAAERRRQDVDVALVWDARTEAVAVVVKRRRCPDCGEPHRRALVGVGVPNRTAGGDLEVEGSGRLVECSWCRTLVPSGEAWADWGRMVEFGAPPADRLVDDAWSAYRRCLRDLGWAEEARGAYAAEPVR